MTAACGGGPSAALPGTSALLSLTAVPVELFATTAGAPPPVAAAIGAIVAASADIATANFCASDPPADPGLLPSDMANILNLGDYTQYLASAQKVTQWFLSHYWWTVCGCTGVPPPTPPPISLPNSPGHNTGLPTTTAGAPCWQASQGFVAPYYPDDAHPWKDVTSELLPQTTSVTVTPPAPQPASTTAQTIPNGATAVQLLGQSSYANLAAEPIWNIVNCYDASGNEILGTGGVVGTMGVRINNNPTLTIIQTVPIPSNAVSWQAFISNHTSVDPQQGMWGINVLCGGGTNLVSPCCPPDPTVQQYLNMILQLLQNLQLPATPSTSWTPGTAHSGISGTGSFNIAKGVTGIRAQFTSIPSAIRVTPGTPTFYWDLGFVTPLAMTYPLRSLRTVFQTQDMPLPIQSDGVAYTFPPGVVVTLIELLPA